MCGTAAAINGRHLPAQALVLARRPSPIGLTAADPAHPVPLGHMNGPASSVLSVAFTPDGTDRRAVPGPNH